MRLLFLGLIPVIVFWLVEEKFGTLWGIIAAIVWAVGECVFEYTQKKRVDRLTLISTGLVVGLGALGAWLDKSVIFKFQPVIIEIIFAAVLIWGGRRGEPLLLKMARQSRPEVFANQREEILQKQSALMARMTRNLIWLLIIHSAFLSYVAINGTTGEWAFWKGIGFNVFLVVWIGGEFLLLRLKR